MRALLGRFAAWLWKATQREYFRPHTDCANCIIMNHLLLEQNKEIAAARRLLDRARAIYAEDNAALVNELRFGRQKAIEDRSITRSPSARQAS